ncbi:MAG: kynureninase [Pseudomonadota bacterium]|nr:kynureninase [Pseudomonadota bacterium]
MGLPVSPDSRPAPARPVSPPSRDQALALDATDALAPLRDRFALPEGVVYLDGNSLGALPTRTAARVQQTIEREWGSGLIRSWNAAGWIELGQEIGDVIAALIGAGAGEVSVGDSTSVNLFKALSAACALQKADAPARSTIVSERSNFPTDLYIAESIAAASGLKLRLVDADGLVDHLDRDTSVLTLTHVNYRNGRMHDMAETTRIAHAAGALVVWDLAHSAGAVPLDVHGADADFAVGCGYKYLNGGPGAPAFLWAHPRHTERMDRDGLRQPLSGWLGHAAPFDFAPFYRPAAGIGRFVCGTPPILSMRALQCGLEVFVEAEAFGGMATLRRKSVGLGDLFIACLERTCADHALRLETPRDDSQRGSQVSFAHGEGFAVMQALIERGVIGDYRAGNAQGGQADLLRFGFAPLYTRYVDAWDAAAALADVLATGGWREPRFQHRGLVT